MMILTWIVALITGFLASLGVGGGMVLILYMTIIMNVDQLTAGWTNLVFFIPIALISVIIHSKNKLILWKKAIPIILIGAVGAISGVHLAKRLDSPILTKIFAVFIILIGIKELVCGLKKAETI